jgi:cold shock CspA family protein
MQALVLGDYNSFEEENSTFIVNVFLVSPEFPSTPLLRLSVLKFLIDKAGEEGGVGGYASVTQMYSYFESMGMTRDSVRVALEEFMNYRLVEPFDASTTSLTNSQRLSVTHCGRMHYEMATTDPIYVSQMAFATPMRVASVVDRIRTIKNGPMSASEWAAVRKIFLLYCLGEDRAPARVPNDPMYNGQRQLRRDLFHRWVHEARTGTRDADDTPPECSHPTLTGRDRIIATVNWFDRVKGYGFLNNDTEGEIFIHKSVLCTQDLEQISKGDKVICNVVPGEKGRFQAIHVHSVQNLRPDVDDDPSSKFERGTIEFYNAPRGFGFVKVPGLRDDAFIPGIVFERSGIKKLSPGDEVEVLVGSPENGRGPIVTALRLV